MAEKFLGAEIKAGEFTDEKTGRVIQFNNLMLYTTSPVSCGSKCNDPVKIKNTVDNICAVFGGLISMEWLKQRVGWYCDVFYNNRRQVQTVIFYEKDPATDPDVMNSVPLGVNAAGIVDNIAPTGIAELSNETPAETAVADTATKKGGAKS